MVPGLGKQSFEQSAGFLRIKNGVNVLDENSNVLHRIEVEEDGAFCFAGRKQIYGVQLGIK